MESSTVDFQDVPTPTRSEPLKTVRTISFCFTPLVTRRFSAVISVTNDFQLFDCGTSTVMECIINGLNVISARENLVRRHG